MSFLTSEATVALRELLVGHDQNVPLLDGTTRRLINLDHAASTPALQSVQATVERFLHWYSSIHRGSGFASQLSTHAYEEARAVVGAFVGAREDQHVVLFGPNTTWALNKLARRLDLQPDNVVICTELEHHANDLPWRQVARVVYARAEAHGQLDEANLAELLQRYQGCVRLVAVTGGSNVTGTIPAIHRLARLAHAAGAKIVVDCAQLAPHRPIDIRDLHDPEHLDYVAFSGHKLYAPFGGGALVGRRDTFARGAPDVVGGGTVRRVTAEVVEWADGPARDEAGTPNVVGAAALAAAVLALQQLGFDTIADHETTLTADALQRLAEVPGLRVYGDPDPARSDQRLGVIPFAIEDVDHRLVAAILSHEYGIAVRTGAFCAHPYVQHLLGAADAGCTGQAPVGLVRISFGLSNTPDDVDTLVAALHAIARGEYRGQYSFDSDTAMYQPRGWEPRFDSYFTLMEINART